MWHSPGSVLIRMSTTFVSFALILVMIVMMPGCGTLHGFSRSSSSTEVRPEVQPQATAPDDAASMAWDFSQRNSQARTVHAPQSSLTASIKTPPPASPSSSSLRDWIPGFGSDSEKPESNPQYVTEEDLLKVVNEFQRVASKDTYRFPIPKDVTGANIYKATLTRLQDYEEKHPGAYPEILAFTRARAYEALHEYDKAIEQYQIVSQSKSPLKEDATSAIIVLNAFRDLQKQPISGSTPVEYLQSLDQQISAWQELQQQYAGSLYEALAREEAEHLDQARVAFLFVNRHRIEDGNESVILSYNQLIDKHKESKNIYRYRIELGDFYFTLAQEYATQNDPESLHFDPSTFEELGRAALRLYAQVAQEDGVIEKLEAKGKLEALKAYMAKIGKLSR